MTFCAKCRLWKLSFPTFLVTRYLAEILHYARWTNDIFFIFSVATSLGQWKCPWKTAWWSDMTATTTRTRRGCRWGPLCRQPTRQWRASTPLAPCTGTTRSFWIRCALASPMPFASELKISKLKCICDNVYLPVHTFEHFPQSQQPFLDWFRKLSWSFCQGRD